MTSQPDRTSVEAEAETVVVQVPADADYLGVIRSAAAHVATKAGCTLPEVADLRLAVDEACNLLLRHTVPDRRAEGPGGAGGAGDLECRFVLDGSTLRVVLGLRASDVDPPGDGDFGWTILAALVDDIVWRVEGPVVQIEIVKHRAAGI